jgi:hypothetical protein
MTPGSSNLLSFHFVCCTKEVSDVISHPVVNLLDIRVVGTSPEVVTKSIYLELNYKSSIPFSIFVNQDVLLFLFVKSSFVCVCVHYPSIK